jgi:hypothetical protein
MVACKHRARTTRVAQDRLADQPLHQRVGQRRQQQRELVGHEARAARPRAEQVQLRLLDPVLRLAALAVQTVVQRVGLALKVGDDGLAPLAL